MSRELDAKVAEVVTGTAFTARDGRREYEVSPRPYSTDIEAAFEVVEKMRERGWWISMKYEPFFKGWEVMVRPKGKSIYGEDCNESLPMAICNAALRAVEGEQSPQ